MNKAYGWILRLGWTAVLVSLVTLPVNAQLMIGHMGHGGDCSIKTGPFPVTFSAYEKPKGQLPPTHAYCDHVPNVGEHILTVDLQGAKSRETPISVRLVSVSEGQGDGENTIMSIPAKLYPSGSVTLAVNLIKLGQYNLLLETEKAGAITIPIHVGEGGGHGGHSGDIGIIEIALLLGVGVGIATFFWLRRRKKPSTTVEEPQQ